jgi:hypothetical protein
MEFCGQGRIAPIELVLESARSTTQLSAADESLKRRWRSSSTKQPRALCQEERTLTDLRTPAQRTLPPDWMDLGNGRTMSRDAYRLSLVILWNLAIAFLLPFAFLLALIPVPSSIMLTIAGGLNDLIWAHFRQISFEGCGDRCWARAYTLISATFTAANAAILGGVILRLFVKWSSVTGEAMRRGAAPWGLTSRGAIRRGPRRGIFVGTLVALAVVSLIVWWMASQIGENAGSNWERGSRRGVNIPAVYSFYWTGMLAGIQALVNSWIFFAATIAWQMRNTLRARTEST